MIRQPARQTRARWALSFADLCLLLLAFFALLQANQATREKTLAGIGNYFGAIETPSQIDLQASALFEPGEALLHQEGRAALVEAAQSALKNGGIVRVQSMGVDAGRHRFDGWDLAAARLGAVARELVAAGIPEQKLRIAGLAERPDDLAPGEQIIRVTQLTAWEE